MKKQVKTFAEIYPKILAVYSDALTAANPYINYANFDENNDGWISPDELHVLTIVAGGEAATGSASPTVWAHRWFRSAGLQLDGKYLYAYTQAGEMQNGHMATIGVFCHELGHDLGLPDLYSYTNDSLGVGGQSLMGSGNWGAMSGEYAGTTPVEMDAWSKSELGWVTPLNINRLDTYSVNSVATGQYNVLKIFTSDPKQFFLVENRQFDGYDAGLSYFTSTPGIAVWHIDESVIYDSSGNYIDGFNDNGQGVDLEEADEGTYYTTRDFFNSSFKTVFNYNSTPNSRLYSGADSGATMSFPDASSGTMTVNVTAEYGALPADTEAPSAPTNLTAAAASGSRIDLSWTASTDNVGVTGYSIERSADGSTGWTEIGTSTTGSYADTTVTAGNTIITESKPKTQQETYQQHPTQLMPPPR